VNYCHLTVLILPVPLGPIPHHNALVRPFLEPLRLLLFFLGKRRRHLSRRSRLGGFLRHALHEPSMPGAEEPHGVELPTPAGPPLHDHIVLAPRQFGVQAGDNLGGDRGIHDGATPKDRLTIGAIITESLFLGVRRSDSAVSDSQPAG
jgi:hypothetical protein